MDTTDSTSRLVAYTRVSTAGQAASGVGMAAQRRAIEDAASAGDFVIAGWFEDNGRSGAKMANRPGLLAALAEIDAGRADGLACASLDRLGRSAGETMTLVERAQRSGWRLLALDAGLDTATAAGELVAMALAMAARFEWRRISERQIDKHAQLRREGRRRGRDGAPREVADRIMAMRENGQSFGSIAQLLNREGVATARGGAEWRPSSVRSAMVARQREREAQRPPPSAGPPRRVARRTHDTKGA